MKFFHRPPSVFDFVPYKQIGPITFGMERSLVAKALDKRPVQVDKQDNVHIDQFIGLGMNVDYDASDRVCMVTLYEDQGLAIKLDEIVLRPGLSAQSVINALKKHESPISDSEGLLFKKSGIGLMVSDETNSKQAQIGSVVIFGPNSFPE